MTLVFAITTLASAAAIQSEGLEPVKSINTISAVQFSPAREDWPMWRFDSQRSACSPNRLAEQLQPVWQMQLPRRITAWDDPLNQDLMEYDRVYEPIVIDGKMIVGFSDQDKIMAVELATGQPAWTFFAEGPIRLAAAGWRDRLFVSSDDGNLYCLNSSAGDLVWKFSGAPSPQHALGNQRLVSAWPARGGAVVRDNIVYFAASIWPFMGTFIYALDAESGRVVWTNDNTGAQYIKQPHSAPSFAGVGPQGSLVATQDYLIVPGGRSVPAVLQRADGRFKHFEINAAGKGNGGAFVAATDQHFFVHTRRNGTRAFWLADGKKTAFTPCEPVLDGDHLFSAQQLEGRELVSCYPAVSPNDEARQPVWSIPCNASDELIGAGNKLVASGGGEITLLEKPSLIDGLWRGGKILQQWNVGELVSRLVVANGRLIAVADSGAIYCYGPAESSQPSADSVSSNNKSQDLIEGNYSPASLDNKSPAAASPRALRRAENRLGKCLAAGQAEGYALWFGPCSQATLEAWIKLSPFIQLAIVDDDATRVQQARKLLDQAGKYGEITVHHAKPREFMPPQHIANMVFISQPAKTAVDEADWRAAYSAVRPFGGSLMVLSGSPSRDSTMSTLADKIQALKLEQATIEPSSWGLHIRREGALPGSADWTHQYGNVANTLKSDDSRVKLPLGILWFGGSSNMDVLPRHGHGPPQQVVAGRLIIQGLNSLSARDVYTGRVLWRREFDDLGTFDVYYDSTYDNTPLDPKYNQVHIPGANSRGTNFVVTEDRVYLIVANQCKILDAATGKDLGLISLPRTAQDEEPEWGYIGVYRDVLLAGVGFAKYRSRQELEFETDKALSASRQGFSSKSLDRAASRGLIGFDRHTGQQLWQVDANTSFWHNGIVAGGGRVYCLDRNPTMVDEALRRRGIERTNSNRILAIDSLTGQTVWQIDQEVNCTWLSYSEQFDLLVLGRALGSDRISDENGRGLRVYNAAAGSLRWANDDLTYHGPCILHNQWIISNTNAYAQSAGAFHIQTGQQRMIANPITGLAQPWKITRAYGCNNIIASENLLTFRSGAAGYYDLLTDAGTGNLGGFKSGCTSNLVVAGGVLNAPDYTRTCSCAYQNQTSLALVHMPGLETWTVNAVAALVPENEIIQTLGINFGAPGDRRDHEGMLWLDYPAVGGDSAPLLIELAGELEYFQQHESTFQKCAQLDHWIFSSGVVNLQQLKLFLRTQQRPKLVPAAKSAGDEEDEKKAAEKKAAEAALATADPTKSAADKTEIKTPIADILAAEAQREKEEAEKVLLYRDPIPPTKYEIKLYFSMPTPRQQQDHEFLVRLGERSALVKLRQSVAGCPDTQIVVFESVELQGELIIDFSSQQGTTCLSGIRIKQTP
jgi:outer membrane protein assembly factor BamB